MDNVSRVEQQKLERAYRYIVRELDLEVQPADPTDYLPRLASELGVSERVVQRARKLLQAPDDPGVHAGRNPVGLAAAALYAAALLCDEKVTQREVGSVADISQVTIRNRYHELLGASEYEIEPG